MAFLRVTRWLALIVVVAGCTSGPVPTPTLPPDLSASLTPPAEVLRATNTARPVPSQAPTRTPLSEPIATASLTNSRPAVTSSPMPLPTLAVFPTLAPAGTATVDGVLVYVPDGRINSLPLPPQVEVSSLPLIPENTAFDGAAQQQGASEVVVPQGWTAWWRQGPVDCSVYSLLATEGPCPALLETGLAYRRPEFTVIPAAGRWLEPQRVLGGGQAARFFCTYGICEGGYVQRVRVTPGEVYVMSAWVQGWCSDSEDHYNSDTATRDGWLNCELAVGIDPAGGLDPLSPTIIWQALHAYDAYVRVETPPVQAAGQIVSLYLKGRSLWGLKHNDFHFDQVEFRPY